jgi:hypothetical protein
MINLFESLGIDLGKYPDDTFIVDLTQENSITYKKVENESKFLDIFSELTVFQYKANNGKGYHLKCYSHDFEIKDLAGLILKIFVSYGKDDRNEGLLMQDELDLIKDDYWLGRCWTNNVPYPCSISYSEDDGLSLFITDQVEQA